FQIKLNGFRIEIEDIESNLRKVDNIKNAIVLPVYKNEKIAYLKGIVELKEDNSLGSIKNGMVIKKELGKYIPSYMIPRNIKVIDEFPTNINGKIDRKKLMEEN
ncbi:MAG: D-alanine--poly(phosphoribitol) ligase, partial [Peptostreptococcaceae bacterium]